MTQTIATRRVARKWRRCMNNYPCGNRAINPGDAYWSLSLPPRSDPFNADQWIHDAECDDCHQSRHGIPVDRDELLGGGTS